MNYLIKTFLILGFIILNLQTKAQVKFGVQTGLNVNNISQNYKDNNLETGTNMRLGYKIGLAVDFGLGNNLGIQSGLLLYSKGFSEDLEEKWILQDDQKIKGFEKYTFIYLEIPLHLAYKFRKGIQVFAGPYFALGIGGRGQKDITFIDGGTVIDETKSDYKLEPVFEEKKIYLLFGEDYPYYSGIDWGIDFGVGYQIGHFLISTSYSFGMANLTPEFAIEFDRDDYKISHRVLSISVCYLFYK